MKATATTIHKSRVEGYVIEQDGLKHMVAEDYVAPVEILPQTIQYSILGELLHLKEIEDIIEAHNKGIKCQSTP